MHGAASGGYVELTQELISHGANLSNAVQGAAFGGHVALTNDLIARGASIDHAANGAASGGNVALINDLVLRGANVKQALWGAWNADHNISTQENALSFISFIDSFELRTLLADKAKKTIETLDTKILLEQVTKLNQLMRENKLTFSQAQEYL
ncbi:MAG: hypothetical protein V4501_00885 [Pseudomonadota bacterium]